MNEAIFYLLEGLQDLHEHAQGANSSMITGPILQHKAFILASTGGKEKETLEISLSPGM